MDVASIRKRLDAAGQSHLLQHWDALSKSDKQSLYAQLDHMDFAEINTFFKESMQSLDAALEKIDDLLEPLPASVCGSVAGSDRKALTKYENTGLDAIGNSNVAVLLLAGGQGTRLGFAYPKGMYDVGLPSGKTMYQIQAERILKVQQNASKLTRKACTVPWYIMTSEHTKEPTQAFFEKHKYFGLERENIMLFGQDLLPCMGFDGKIYLADKHTVALAPDGNGGLYRAVRNKGVLADMERRGIKYIHVYCVDNILVKMADPVFLGFCISRGVNCGAKVVEKVLPTEPVGVMCKVKGKYQVVEYSEIKPETAERPNKDGRLMFNAGNICNHFFTMDFLKLAADPAQESKLKHHIAKKKIPFVNSSGDIVKPTEPNGVKMEKFVFDVFLFATDRKIAVWDVPREDEFAPLKNADGAAKDTPTTCRQLLYNLHYKQVLSAGGKFVRKDGSDIPQTPIQQTADEGNGIVCEISPLVSYAGEGLEELVSKQSFVAPVAIEMSPAGKVKITQGPGAGSK